jgi:hypothetical protein
VTALLDGRSNKADTLPTLKVRCHCSAQTSYARGEDYDVTAPELGICLEQDLRVSRAKTFSLPISANSRDLVRRNDR